MKSIFLPLIVVVLFILLSLRHEKILAQINIGNIQPTKSESSPIPTTLPTATSQNPTNQPVATLTVVPTTQSDCKNIDIPKMIQSITEENMRDYVRHLVDDDSISGHDELRSRASGSIGNRVEAEYIMSHYDKFSISNNTQNVPMVSSDNIIATIAGKDSNSVFIVGGHYDSVTTAAADDNGSGTAVIMEVARAIKESGFCPNYTLEFINFTGEELGLYGSINYVKLLPPDKTVKGMINLDMVSNPSAIGDCVEFIAGPYNPGFTIAEKLVELDKKYLLDLNAKAVKGSVGASDHYPFQIKGIPAVFGTECTFNKAVYHKPSDTSDKINYRQLAKTAKVVAATVIELTK